MCNKLETTVTSVDLSTGNSELFINRELSWIEFNRRVLNEAMDKRHPLLERVKFLSIFASNLDEFMMIRVSGLRRQQKGGVLESPPDGLTPTEQLIEIRKEVKLQISDAVYTLSASNVLTTPEGYTVQMRPNN